MGAAGTASDALTRPVPAASFSAANGISFCLFAGLFGALFLLSQFFQTAQGRTPLQAGAGLLAWSAWGFFVGPATGRAAGRYGNRPFMFAELILQTAGLACLALIAHRHTGYLQIAPLLAFAGIGGPMVFTTVAGAAMGSVAPDQIGIASGTNNALRELGGVFGIAVLAAVFNRPGIYNSPDTFVSGFRAALLGGRRLLRSRHPADRLPQAQDQSRSGHPGKRRARTNAGDVTRRKRCQVTGTRAAGLYELTPLKRACRRRRENVRSGSWFGFYCVGSSIGLMLVLLAVGAMKSPGRAPSPGS
jgi:MFS family permease